MTDKTTACSSTTNELLSFTPFNTSSSPHQGRETHPYKLEVVHSGEQLTDMTAGTDEPHHLLRQLPEAEEVSLLEWIANRPRERRLSEHGCGCCWMGLNTSDSSPHCVDVVARPQEVQQDSSAPSPNKQDATTDPVAAKPSRKPSPFAGFALSFTDQDLSQKGPQRSGSSVSKLDQGANCQLVDEEGMLVSAFAIVSVSRGGSAVWSPASSPVQG